MALLEGPVVFIDDELFEDGTNANKLYRQISQSGRPVAGYEEIPPASHRGHWEGLSFVVVDWNLGDHSGPGASRLQEESRRDLVDFLADVAADYFCPIFVVSSMPRTQIEDYLAKNGAARLGGIFPERVQVFGKDAVLDNFLEHLEGWVSSDLALTTLRAWDREYQKAKSRLFSDLGGYAKSWPSFIIEAAERDGVDPAIEIAEVIQTNLQNRINPLVFDDLAVSGASHSGDPSHVRDVHFGRSVLPAERIPSSSIAPGDIFEAWRESDPKDSLWMNVTPSCHTVRSRHESDAAVLLHLVRGVPVELSNPNLDKAIRAVSGPNVEIVHVLRDGKAYKFEFKQRRIVSWRTVKDHRYARLLPPFITHFQQHHSAFMLSEGLPSLHNEMYH